MNEGFLVPSNTSVLIRRVPIVNNKQAKAQNQNAGYDRIHTTFNTASTSISSCSSSTHNEVKVVMTERVIDVKSASYRVETRQHLLHSYNKLSSITISHILTTIHTPHFYM